MDEKDTERLDFLLKYFRIDDIGEEEVAFGVGIKYEDLETALSYNECSPAVKAHDDNLRDIIDRAIRR